MVTPRMARIKPWSHRGWSGLSHGHTEESPACVTATREKARVTVWSQRRIQLRMVRLETALKLRDGQ